MRWNAITAQQSISENAPVALETTDACIAKKKKDDDDDDCCVHVYTKLLLQEQKSNHGRCLIHHDNTKKHPTTTVKRAPRLSYDNTNASHPYCCTTTRQSTPHRNIHTPPQIFSGGQKGLTVKIILNKKPPLNSVSYQIHSKKTPPPPCPA